MVKGDLIVPQSDRIMTRSRARQSTSPTILSPSLLSHPSPPISTAWLAHQRSRQLPKNVHLTDSNPQDPDRYTIIPAPLKILKVLVEELLSASGNARSLSSAAAAAAELADDAGNNSEDGDWEDDPDEFDLGLPGTKAELMAYAGEDGGTGNRQRDDETQAYLMEFFRGMAGDAAFREVFGRLSPEEQEKLRGMS